MVTVSNYARRTSGEGEEFIALILQGDLEMVQSKETGRFYATAKTCSVSSTFTEEIAQQMIGKTIPGRIIRQECDSYEYVIPESGEIVELSHRWVYTPEETDAIQFDPVNKPRPVQPATSFLGNGVNAVA